MYIKYLCIFCTKNQNFNEKSKKKYDNVCAHELMAYAHDFEVNSAKHKSNLNGFSRTDSSDFLRQNDHEKDDVSHFISKKWSEACYITKDVLCDF